MNNFTIIGSMALLIVILLMYLSLQIPLFPQAMVPVKIGNFEIYGENQTVEIFFTLLDKNNGEIPIDGHAQFNITSSKGDNLYSDEFEIKKSDFATIEEYSGDTTIDYNGYYWEVPYSNLKYYPSNVSASIAVTTNDGKILTGTAEGILE